jgi:hypothetical protein
MEIASRAARKQFADGTVLEATYALHSDGTVTRQITSAGEVPQNNKPTVFRQLNEAERRACCADRISAIGCLRDAIDADGWEA